MNTIALTDTQNIKCFLSKYTNIKHTLNDIPNDARKNRDINFNWSITKTTASYS